MQKPFAYLLGGVLGMIVLRQLFTSSEAQAEELPAGNDVDPDYQEKAGTTYKPGSAEQVRLFEKAAEIADLPTQWASDTSFHKLLAAESGGRVGIPNFLWAKWLGVSQQKMRSTPSLWPKVWKVLRDGKAKPSYTGISSHAAGLGQLQPAAMKDYQPSGVQGVGIPVEEAVGMLRYVKSRYGTPAKAWASWKANEASDGYGWY